MISGKLFRHRKLWVQWCPYAREGHLNETRARPPPSPSKVQRGEEDRQAPVPPCQGNSFCNWNFIIIISSEKRGELSC